MQRLLTRGLTCRIIGVDESGFEVFSILRERHMKHAIFLPTVLRHWDQRLKQLRKNVDRSADTDNHEQENAKELSTEAKELEQESAKELSTEAKEIMRQALGIFIRQKTNDCVTPVTVKKLPKKQKLFTVLKGPHIDKKAREQFFFTTHGVELFMKINSISAMKLTEMLTRFYETGTNEVHITARF